MKQFFFLLSLSIALTLSALAKADDQNRESVLTIKQVQYDANSMIVKASGSIPSSCAVSPRPVLLKTDNEAVLTLAVSVSESADVCAAVTSGIYRLAFDIRSLKFELADMGLNPNGVYKIVSGGGELAIEVDFSQVIFNLPYSSEDILGRVAQDDSGNFTLITKSGSFAINSPFINMHAFNGKRVEVNGHIITSQTPSLNFSGSAGESSSILVTGINTTSY